MNKKEAKRQEELNFYMLKSRMADEDNRARIRRTLEMKPVDFYLRRILERRRVLRKSEGDNV